MCKQMTLYCDLVKEKSYFRQELHKLYENFIKAYYFLIKQKMRQRNNL